MYFVPLNVPCSNFTIVVEKTKQNLEYMRIYSALYEYLSTQQIVSKASSWMASDGIVAMIYPDDGKWAYELPTAPGLEETGPGYDVPVRMYITWIEEPGKRLPTCAMVTDEALELLLVSLDGGGLVM